MVGPGGGGASFANLNLKDMTLKCYLFCLLSFVAASFLNRSQALGGRLRSEGPAGASLGKAAGGGCPDGLPCLPFVSLI